MEFLVRREHLLPVMSRGAGVVERRHTLPILGNLLLTAEKDRLSVVSTDLEIEVRAECTATVTAEGQITVPARKLLDIVRNLPDGSELQFRVKGERCSVMSGRGRYVLGTLPASDFPLMQADSEGAIFRVEEGSLRVLLEKTCFAMAQQDVRYYLNGLLLEFENGVIRGVATDGHRLARYDLRKEELNVEGERLAVIVPYKAVMELRRQLGMSDAGVEIRVGERTVRFIVGDVVTTSKLIDGRFPDYDRVIAAHHGRTAILDREQLRGALVRTAVLSNEKFRGVRMEFESGVLRLQAHNPEQEQAEEEVDARLEGEPVALGFNVSYLSDVLGAVAAEEVEISFEDANSSSVWRGVGATEETFVVMPMRL